MCGGADHIAWKRLVSSEACRGLRTAGGYDRFCQGSFKVHPYPFRATLPLQVEPQILRLRLSPLHVGASEGLQSLFSYSSDPVFPLFSLQLRVLRDLFEFEYRLDHLCHVTLDYVFHSMSLACFLLRAFSLISWLDTPLHFVFTCSILWDMFIDHLFLHCMLITGLVPHHLFDPWFNFRLDARIFITER